MPGHTFNDDATRRIKATVKRVEAMPRELGGEDQQYRVPRHQVYLGKLDGALAQGGSATVSLWQFSTSAGGADTGRDVTAYDWFLASGSLASGTKVKVEWLSGRWFVTAASC